MTTSKHTPGPWYVEGGLIYSTATEAAYRRGIAAVYELRDDPHSTEEEANAALIAAAPEMYEALRDLVHYLGYDYSAGPTVLDAARAILARIDEH